MSEPRGSSCASPAARRGARIERAGASCILVPSGLEQPVHPGTSHASFSNRAPDEMRKVTFERGVARYAEGSCLVRFGDTHVLCTASLEDKPPQWLRGQGRGWITAEYAMLPRATLTRTRRESTTGKPSGRTQEIQRLIGRSLRAVVDLGGLGERQISIDCDVLQADGGTRTAAATDAWVALNDCLKWMTQRSILREPIRCASLWRRSPAASSGARPCWISTMPRILHRRNRRQFRHDRRRIARRSAGDGRGRPFQRAAIAEPVVAGARRHRAIGRDAEGERRRLASGSAEATRSPSLRAERSNPEIVTSQDQFQS